MVLGQKGREPRGYFAQETGRASLIESEHTVDNLVFQTESIELAHKLFKLMSRRHVLDQIGEVLVPDRSPGPQTRFGPLCYVFERCALE